MEPEPGKRLEYRQHQTLVSRRTMTHLFVAVETNERVQIWLLPRRGKVCANLHRVPLLEPSKQLDCVVVDFCACAKVKCRTLLDDLNADLATSILAAFNFRDVHRQRILGQYGNGESAENLIRRFLTRFLRRAWHHFESLRGVQNTVWCVRIYFSLTDASAHSFAVPKIGTDRVSECKKPFSALLTSASLRCRSLRLMPV